METPRQSYTVAGANVTFACADGETAEKVARLVGGWHFTVLPDDPPSAFTIEVSRESPPPMPHGAATFAVHHGECFAEEDLWYLATSDSWMRVHPLPRGRVEVWIGAETMQSPTSFARLLFYATQAALRQCGLYELHAAAVTPPDRDAGLLIAGASGSGKTTLAMRLTAAGWSNVADDLVVISDRAAAVEAFAFRRVFAATETTLEAFPLPRLEEATREANAFEPSKRRLDPAVLFPGRFASSCTPRVLLFPVITGEAQTELQPMAAPDALTRLLRMCPWASYDTAVARPHLNALATLARQCASYTLLAGTDLLYDAEAAPRRFAPLLAPVGAR
ncbi:MAG TPA: hypothetical protein VHW00_06715 [Thermoanaerobaculia bacterium]|nr:hypothetical protein [Thermoanaerobaculia bacterium]